MTNLSRKSIVALKPEIVNGKEKKKARFCAIVSPNIINFNAHTVIVCPIVPYEEEKAKSFLFVSLPAGKTTGLHSDALINTLQIKTIEKKTIMKRIGKVPQEREQESQYALGLVTGLDENVHKI